MKFDDMKAAMEKSYAGKFPASYCRVLVTKQCCKTISINCYMAKDKSEYRYGIDLNDMFKVRFSILLPDDWTTDQELPEKMEMEGRAHEVYAKVKPGCYGCGRSVNVSYRKTTGNAEKLIKSFDRFVGKLYDTCKEEYLNNDLLKEDMELVRSKNYF